MGTAPFEEHVSCTYGAPMGRRSADPSNFYGKVHLRRVPFVDGDYDPGGAYWGGGRGVEPLYCAWQDACDLPQCIDPSCPDAKAMPYHDHSRDECVHYFRARNRREAKRQLLELNPQIIFFAYPGESDYH